MNPTMSASSTVVTLTAAFSMGPSNGRLASRMNGRVSGGFFARGLSARFNRDMDSSLMQPVSHNIGCIAPNTL